VEPQHFNAVPALDKKVNVALASSQFYKDAKIFKKIDAKRFEKIEI
jgi:hypothetical protein